MQRGIGESQLLAFTKLWPFSRRNWPESKCAMSPSCSAHVAQWIWPKLFSTFLTISELCRTSCRTTCPIPCSHKSSILPDVTFATITILSWFVMDHIVYHALSMTHSFWMLKRVTKVEIESKHEPGRPVAESPVTLADREAEDGPGMKCLDDKMWWGYICGMRAFTAPGEDNLMEGCHLTDFDRDPFPVKWLWCLPDSRHCD